MGGVLGLLIGLGLLLVFGPIGATAVGVKVGGLAAAIMVAFGVLLLVASTIAIIITRLYVKTKADEAFVRTGMGGMRIIKDGGAVVIPVVHQRVIVPLRTFRLEVLRKGGDALLSKDKLRVDIKAEFFVRIQPNDDDITNAARSLGDRTEHEGTIKALIEDKLVSALRTVAATKTLEQLNSERDEFVQTVMNSVKMDLKHNGFTLETATISQLDQAKVDALDANNVFDAEGLLTIARITEEKKTEANAIKKRRERERQEQDVQQRQEMLKLEQQRAQAEAEQAAAVAKAKAEQNQLAKEAQFKAEQAIFEAEYAKTQAADVAKAKAEQAVEVAVQEKGRAVAVAKEEAEQAREVAERRRQQAVAEAEKERVDAEAKRLVAEKAREAETQAIETVKVKAKADRDKEQAVIAAEAAAQTQYVTAAKKADADAYAMEKSASAKKAAAAADAEAITKKAEADATAATKRAEGDRATQLVPIQVKREQVAVDKDAAMIPVDVASKQVDVDKRRVDDVLKPELEAREAHGKTAQDFELAKLRIVQEAGVRIETARAVAAFGTKFETTLYGTPEDVARMQQSMLSGMSAANVGNGFFEGASPETAGAVAATVDRLGKLLEVVASHVGVKALPNGDTFAPSGAAPAAKPGKLAST